LDIEIELKEQVPPTSVLDFVCPRTLDLIDSLPYNLMVMFKSAFLPSKEEFSVQCSSIHGPKIETTR
jgi:hypothetical protein